MKALITGITGQDGSYLAELLLSKGYEVHGIVRRMALEDPLHRLWRIRHLLNRLILHSGSLESYGSIFNTIEEVHPDECYHLAAQSFVSYSFEDEFSTINTNINGTLFSYRPSNERPLLAGFIWPLPVRPSVRFGKHPGMKIPLFIPGPPMGSLRWPVLN